MEKSASLRLVVVVCRLKVCVCELVCIYGKADEDTLYLWPPAVSWAVKYLHSVHFSILLTHYSKRIPICDSVCTNFFAQCTLECIYCWREKELNTHNNIPLTCMCSLSLFGLIIFTFIYADLIYKRIHACKGYDLGL